MSLVLVSLLLLQDVAAPPAPVAPAPAEPAAVSSDPPEPASASPAPPSPPPPVAAAAPAPATPAVPRPLGTLSDEQIRWIGRRASGVGIGYDNGLWGGSYGQSLKLSIPFGRKLGRFFGVRLRGLIAHHADAATDRYDPVVNVGAELFGRSPVWWGVLRVYGGGGLWAGIRPHPTNVGSRYGLGGGGHVGIEAFASPFMAFTFEIGGQAPGHSLGVDAGASVMGGMIFYLGRTDTRWRDVR